MSQREDFSKRIKFCQIPEGVEFYDAFGGDHYRKLTKFDAVALEGTACLDKGDIAGFRLGEGCYVKPEGREE